MASNLQKEFLKYTLKILVSKISRPLTNSIIVSINYLFILQKKRCASGYGTKVAVKVAGGQILESEQCVTDDKLVTAATTSDLPAFVHALSTALGLSVVF